MVIQGDVQCDLTFGRVRRHEFQCLFDERDEVGRLELVWFVSLANAREIEDIFDERREPAAFLNDEPEIVGLLMRVHDFTAIEAFGHKAH